jgi:prophage antirepressor-like protein
MTKAELFRVAVFEGKHIRKIMHEGEWWFSVVDIVEILTGSSIPKRYWSDLKNKLVSEGFTEAYEKIIRLKMVAPDGKMRLTDCANTETMFRIIQSIPSPKVEPLKQWLAEATTTRLHRDRDTKGVEPLKKDAREGGEVAGSTRRDIEKRTGKPVVTSDNFKGLTGNSKKKIV